jgi:RNA recognition motif-containing protein
MLVLSGWVVIQVQAI